MSKRNRKYRRGRLWFFALLPFALVLIVYMGFTIYFMGHFYYGSTINGTDYTGKTVKEVEEAMTGDIHDYVLTIYERGGAVEKIKADEIGLTYVSDGKVTQLKQKQNPFLWPKAYFRKESYEMSATTIFDAEMLKGRVERLSCQDKDAIIKPQNAYYNYEDGVYRIIDEVEGNQPKKDMVYNLVLEAVNNGDTLIDLEENNVYLAPKIRKENKKLNGLVNTLNKYIGVTITYDFGDRTEELTGTTIKDWLEIDKYSVTLNEQSVRDYVDWLSRTYNTFGNTRSFTTWDGSPFTVKGGDYGWLISLSAETQELISIVKKGESVKRPPVYLQYAYCRDKNDIGDTYVEINLTAQHMWFFKEGELLVSTDIVSGNEVKKHGTPVGTYQITYKERNATLKGEDYATPVNYWLPFNRNVGIHDANWRNKFGGELYKKSGSHGCINTPPSKAAIIYENIEQGVPVVVYKRKLDKSVLETLSKE